jgi:hypothetical protein
MSGTQPKIGLFADFIKLHADTPANRRTCAGPNQRHSALLRMLSANHADSTHFTKSSADLFSNPGQLATQLAAIGPFTQQHQNPSVCFITSLPVSLPPPCSYRGRFLFLRTHVLLPHLRLLSRRYARHSARNIIGH